MAEAQATQQRQGGEAAEDAEAPVVGGPQGHHGHKRASLWGPQKHLGHQRLVRASAQVLAHLAALLLLGLAALAAL